VEAARQLAASRGWDGLLVVGRGGGAVDRLGQLWYLTDAYPSFPSISDLDGAWSDRGFAAAIITPAKVTVCGDDELLAAGGAVADTVKVDVDLPHLIADTLSESGLRTAHLGLAGSDVLTVSQRDRLEALVPQLTLSDADDALMAGRMIKSDAEIAMLRRAAAVGLTAMSAAMNSVALGVTEAEYCAAAAREVVAAGAMVANAFAYVFGPDSDDPRRRMPTYDATRPLRQGDLATLDISGALDGYFFDLARSRTVTSPATPEQERALRLVKDVVDAAVAELHAGRTVATAARAGYRLLQAVGYTDTARDRFDALGHGLGLGFEPPWIRTDNDTIVEVGMCIAVELFCAIDGTGATYERTIVVTGAGPVDLVV
jgi:Xaa-Pro aminopeptidase